MEARRTWAESSPMLSALDLAGRIEAGSLSPAAVIERAAQAIAAREAEIHAFTALDLDGARRRAEVAAAALAFVQPWLGLLLNVSLWVLWIRVGYRSR